MSLLTSFTRGGLGLYQPMEWVSGQYYSLSALFPMGVNTLAVSADTLYSAPIYVATPTLIDRIGVEITTSAAAGKLFRLGIYTDNPTDHKPNALLVDSGALAADAAPGMVQETISLVLNPGWYWRTILSDGAPTVRNDSTYFSPHGNSSGTTFVGTSWTRSVTYAALPATFGAATDSSSSPRILLRKA